MDNDAPGEPPPGRPSKSGHDVVVFTSGRFSAGINRHGGRLEFFRCEDRDLVVPAPPGAEPGPGFHGAVIGPWPNRVADGTWTFDGLAHSVAINERATGTALHGFTPWLEWDVAATAPDRVTATVGLLPRSGWPHHLDVVLDARLDEHGLELELAATNVGSSAAAWGATIHPYLCAPGSPADWTVLVPASQVLEVDDRLLPVALVDVDGTTRDLRHPRPAAELDLDHAFTGLEPGPGDHASARAEVRTTAGDGVHITWSAHECPWVQVYTGDERGVAIEPMTCPPDAPRSGRDLVVLAPTETHTTRWRIGPVSAVTSVP